MSASKQSPPTLHENIVDMLNKGDKGSKVFISMPRNQGKTKVTEFLKSIGVKTLSPLKKKEKDNERTNGKVD